MLTSGARSLDILKTLLVYASWYVLSTVILGTSKLMSSSRTLRSHYFAAVLPQFQSSGIIQLIIASVYDLALNKVWPIYCYVPVRYRLRPSLPDLPSIT
jgi:hypothetical protein